MLFGGACCRRASFDVIKERAMVHKPDIPIKLKSLREHFLAECRADVPGVLAARTYSSNFHESLRKSFRNAKSASQESWALVAVGGFGRGELSISSDLDLLVLYRKRLPPDIQELLRELVYGLWDTGFEVGNATASVSSVKKMVQEDFSILTNYLEAKLIAGDEEFFREWRDGFLKFFGNQSRRRFLQNLTEYRNTRLKQYGESPYLLEPHVKEGVGGMRDVQTIRWAGIVYLQDPSLDAAANKGWLTETGEAVGRRGLRFSVAGQAPVASAEREKTGPDAFCRAGTNRPENGVPRRDGRVCGGGFYAPLL